jgi:hypothetical protein
MNEAAKAQAEAIFKRREMERAEFEAQLEKKRGGQNTAQKSLKIYKKVSRCCTKRQPRYGQSSLREVERNAADQFDLPTARHP